MRIKLFFRISFSILLVLLLSNCKGKQTKISSTSFDIPLNESSQVVVDLSNLFTSIESDSLAKKIIQYEEKTTNQIAVLTIDSLPKNTPIKLYGTQVANSWGIGTKEKNNGLLITVSKFDRKTSISTGIGTEKTISDYECKVIIDSIMIPSFKNKLYFKGVNKAIDSLIHLWD